MEEFIRLLSVGGVVNNCSVFTNIVNNYSIFVNTKP